MKLEASVHQVKWRTALRAAHTLDLEAAPDARQLVLVRVESSDGAAGYGEAAPLTTYDGVSLDDVLDALAHYERVLSGGAGLSHAELMAECAAAAALPQALAAVDLALWDLAGQRSQQPIWSLLGSSSPPVVDLNATIGAENPPKAAAEARNAAGRGFDCLKIKVGDPQAVARVRAVRAAVGPELQIRVDANGGWLLDEAVRALNEMSELGIELCEEPVHGVFGIAAVARTVPHVTIAADETAADPTLYRARVCGAVCLKISASGGITGVLRDAVAARNAGYDVYLASTLDGPLGIAAALHVAAVVEPHRPCGLATLERFDAPDILEIHGGMLSAPSGAGLGDRLVSWYDSL